MGGGMKFLNTKPWHPTNWVNQRRIYIAEQKAKETTRREKEAREELEKDSDVLRFSAMAKAGVDQDARSGSVNFLYAPPPGLKLDEQQGGEGEDEAVAKFKKLLALKRDPNFSSAAKQSSLEKLLGRKEDRSLTMDEQVERFPFLKDAPVEHEYAKNVKLNFKPVGKLVRNTRCMRCGEWGHQSGDRECPMLNENPLDADRQRREDPLTYMSQQGGLDASGNLVLKQRALPREMAMMDANSQVVVSDGESEKEEDFLATLSSKQKKLLLKKLKGLEETGQTPLATNQGHKGKKAKSKKKRRREASSKGSRKRKQDKAKQGRRKATRAQPASKRGRGSSSSTSSSSSSDSSDSDSSSSSGSSDSRVDVPGDGRHSFAKKRRLT